MTRESGRVRFAAAVVVALSVALVSACGGQTAAGDLPKTFDCATVSSRVHFVPNSVGEKSPKEAANAQLPASVRVTSKPSKPTQATHEVEYFAYRDGKLVADVRVVKLPGKAGFRVSASERCTSEKVGRPS